MAIIAAFVHEAPVPQSPHGKTKMLINLPEHDAHDDDTSDPVSLEIEDQCCLEKTSSGPSRCHSPEVDEDLQLPQRILTRPPSMKSIKSVASRPAALVLPSRDQPVDRTKSNVTAAVPNPLARLMPLRVAPKMRLPKMTPLWAFLDRIECITVGDVYTTTADDDEDSGTVYYVLNVYYYQERQGIPTHRFQPSNVSAFQTLSSTPPARQPDCQVHHRFSSFLTLQRRLQKAVTCKHELVCRNRYIPDYARDRPCAYCQQIRHFIETTAGLDWKAKLFTTVGMRMTLLSQFVANLLVLARLQRDACSNLEMLRIVHQPSNTYVERSVPGLLRRFLTAQTGETFMR